MSNKYWDIKDQLKAVRANFRRDFETGPSSKRFCRNDQISVTSQNSFDTQDNFESISSFESSLFDVVPGSSTVNQINHSDLAPWEKHSNSFGSEMLQRMGYVGGGLGKHGNGILNPITTDSTIDPSGKFHPTRRGKPLRVENKIFPWPKNTTLITGSSMIAGLNEKRLAKYNAKVRCFPGALIDDMYDCLQPYLKKTQQISSYIFPVMMPHKNQQTSSSKNFLISNHISRVFCLMSNFFYCARF